MSKTKSTNTVSVFQFMQFLFYLGLMLTAAQSANALTRDAERERMEQEARAHLGDAVEPCKLYLETQAVCMFQGMGLALEGESSDACDQVPALLAQIPEDKQAYCADLFRHVTAYSEVQVDTHVSGSRKGVKVRVENSETEVKSSDFALQFADSAEKANCGQYVEAAVACDNSGSASDCDNAARFFSQLPKPAQQACTQMKAMVEQQLEDGADQVADVFAKLEL